ncbi:MAG: hypothetical protein OXH70_17395 [Acidobacteria bacterium]|nr:hypothetical protein [Acidobacteriota bacterium]
MNFFSRKLDNANRCLDLLQDLVDEGRECTAERLVLPPGVDSATAVTFARWQLLRAADDALDDATRSLAAAAGCRPTTQRMDACERLTRRLDRTWRRRDALAEVA